MNPLEAITQPHRERTSATRTGALMALLLAFVAVAALAEVLANRAATLAATPRAASWERALQIGDDARGRGDALAARRAYLTALFRARGGQSLPGVIEAAERFTALGDREVVGHALSMATAFRVADHDVEVQHRLQALRDRFRASSEPPLTVSAPR